MASKLINRVALVTGGTKGIGRGIAKAFVDEGAKVFISGRDATAGERAASDLGSAAEYIGCDVSDAGAIQRMVDAVAAKAGRLDILVNSAGGATAFSPIADMSDEMWEDMLTLNLTSSFRSCRAAIKYMAPSGYGRIINISSVEGKHGKAGLVHYVAAKHGLNGFTKGLSKELGPLGITVNAICPGLVITDLIRNQADKAAAANNMDTDSFLTQYAQQAAIGRPITVEEVAALAVVVASEAGGGISGAMLSVDGGTAAY